ncbi:PREDICTED: serine/threonine-protein kinase-like protein CCR4 [Ipomoea nil]|uniref:serine/threonine-protein kinase-like protein CCR4 n=1 Tax=Ipomoea nil TaxID=35883 RepID=UPI00090180C0|nr:PREDICTED: serine/threonine-protein kinase-like protein CCR4 [Ipomoea nil]
MAYKRIYNSPKLADLGSGNSHICGIVENFGGLQCLQWLEFRHSNQISLTTNLASGQDFICGLRDSGKVQCLGRDSNVTDHDPNGTYDDLAAGGQAFLGIGGKRNNVLRSAIGECNVVLHHYRRLKNPFSLLVRRGRSRGGLGRKAQPIDKYGKCWDFRRVSLQVLQQVTNNFSEEHRISEGSFRSVYHATLEDGRRVAIKRAEFGSGIRYRQEDNDNAFLNELEFLSRLHHKNLVNLLGYCEDNNERLESSQLMSWTARIRVAIDSAGGIEYLHEHAVPQVIYRDIKSSNILLDNSWTAKVSDFGLSLMGPQDDKSHLSLQAAGTMGYLDTEYYMMKVLTTKSDVYSFGVVLLELLLGKKAIHNSDDGEARNVVSYAVPNIQQDNIAWILDRRVPPSTPFKIDAITYIGYIAVDYVKQHCRDRPTMTEILNKLERALTVDELATQDIEREEPDDEVAEIKESMMYGRRWSVSDASISKYQAFAQTLQQ